MTLKLYEKLTYNEINPYVNYHVTSQAIEKLFLDAFFRELKLDLQYFLINLQND